MLLPQVAIASGHMKRERIDGTKICIALGEGHGALLPSVWAIKHCSRQVAPRLCIEGHGSYKCRPFILAHSGIDKANEPLSRVQSLCNEHSWNGESLLANRMQARIEIHVQSIDRSELKVSQLTAANQCSRLCSLKVQSFNWSTICSLVTTMHMSCRVFMSALSPS